MILQLVNSKEDLKIFNDVIIKHHSYVPTVKSVGRSLRWIIYKDTTILGVISLGSSTYPPCKDILKHLNISKDDYKKSFNTFANNWRYCLILHEKNLGTKVLKEFRKQSKIEWKKKYGDDLKYIITFIGAGKTGAMYKADNWTMIGETAGLPKHKSSSMKWHSGEELKSLFVKPTGENKKLIFIKELI